MKRNIGLHFKRGDEVVYETDDTTIVARVKENHTDEEFIHYVLVAIKIKGRNRDRRNAGGEFRAHVRREHADQAPWGLRDA